MQHRFSRKKQIRRSTHAIGRRRNANKTPHFLFISFASSDSAQPEHKAKLDDVAVHKEELSSPITLASSDRVASCAASTDALTGLVREKNVAETAEEEEGICAEAVEEDDPVDHCATKAEP